MDVNLIHRQIIQETISNLMEENIKLRAQIILSQSTSSTNTEIPLEDPEGESSVGESKL